MRRAKAIIPITALALMLAGCSTGSTPESADPPASSEEADLYETAKTESSLTWYSSQDPARNDAVVQAFLEKYPDLSATSFRLASGELANRFSQETESGVNTAGLVTIASPEFIQQGQEDGWFEEIAAEDFPELEEFPEQFFVDGVVTTGINVFGIGFNTDLVADPPADWDDVLDGDYKGKIVFGDPRNVPGYVALATIWIDEYGEDFLTNLADQNLIVVDSMVPGMQQVAAGEGSIGLPGVPNTVNPIKDQGAPLDLVYPDATTGVEFQTMIPRETPSPATAELLYQFLLTEEGQQAFNGTAGASPMGAGDTAELPSDYRSVDLGTIADNRDRVLKLLGIQ
jgi:iron(III) transport system substrate-binding protein